MKHIRIVCYCGKTVSASIEFDVEEKLKCPRCDAEYSMRVKKGEDVPIMRIQQRVDRKYYKSIIVDE